MSRHRERGFVMPALLLLATGFFMILGLGLQSYYALHRQNAVAKERLAARAIVLRIQVVATDSAP